MSSIIYNTHDTEIEATIYEQDAWPEVVARRGDDL